MAHLCSYLSPQSGAVQVLVRSWGPSHGAPAYSLGCRTLLVELCRPEPQLAEHGLHSDQLDHTQSTGGGRREEGKRI